MRPFKLIPEYREYVWGGKRIRPDAERTAEAWVVYENNIIADGSLAGKTLAEVAREKGASLLGTKVNNQTGDKFPLLVKILDCADWLSLQVHPNNEQAKKWEGPGHFGKMEGWYIIEADEEARLISGFKPGITRGDIESTVGRKALLDIVEWQDINSGDALLISPGTMHALGPGMLVYEVQQTSDITYRVYDWDRPMKAGRKLHLEQAADVLDPDADGGLSRGDIEFSGEKELFSCQFFKLNLIKDVSDPVQRDTKNESFHCLTVVEGTAKISGHDWHRDLDRFETLLIPADCGTFSISVENGSCLESFVPS